MKLDISIRSILLWYRTILEPIVLKNIWKRGREREREEESQGGRRKEKYKEYNRNTKNERKMCKEKEFFDMN